MPLCIIASYRWRFYEGVHCGRSVRHALPSRCANPNIAMKVFTNIIFFKVGNMAFLFINFKAAVQQCHARYCRTHGIPNVLNQ